MRIWDCLDGHVNMGPISSSEQQEPQVLASSYRSLIAYFGKCINKHIITHHCHEMDCCCPPNLNWFFMVEVAGFCSCTVQLLPNGPTAPESAPSGQCFLFVQRADSPPLDRRPFLKCLKSLSWLLRCYNENAFKK